VPAIAPELALQLPPRQLARTCSGLGWSLRPARRSSGRLRTGHPALRRHFRRPGTLRHLGDGEELISETAPGIFRQRIEQGPPIVEIKERSPDGSMSARTVDGAEYLFRPHGDARRGRAALDPFRLELSAIVDVRTATESNLSLRAAKMAATRRCSPAISWNDGASPRSTFRLRARARTSS
jgi:hypothetical protein